MAASSVIKNQYGAGSIVISDGTGSPLSVTVDFDQGDFSISGLKDQLKDTTTYQSRGTLHSVRHTARTFPTISFTAMMSEFKDASSGTAIDMILGQHLLLHVCPHWEPMQMLWHSQWLLQLKELISGMEMTTQFRSMMLRSLLILANQIQTRSHSVAPCMAQSQAIWLLVKQ